MDKKIYLITGGTGTFGLAVLNKLLSQPDIDEIRIFSRDDIKHNNMRQTYKDSRIKYIIGDVKDKESIDLAMKDVQYVFHAAALKLVPSCEQNPLEAVLVNVLGSHNVLDVALKHKVKKIVLLSTDKVVYPISAMGATKLLMEKIVQQRIATAVDTEIVLTRFGNIIESTGSVTDKFLQQIQNEENLTITGKHMTRFMMTNVEAADLVWYAFEKGKHGSTYISKMKSFTIENVAKALLTIKQSSVAILYGDSRPGDKLYERLVTEEEEHFLLEEDNFYRVHKYQQTTLNTPTSQQDALSYEDTLMYFEKYFVSKHNN
jgi:UDP-glucose 4-epimerase